VCQAEHTPFKMFTIENSGLVDLISKKWRGEPRQNIPLVYRETGAIYVLPLKTLSLGDIAGEKPKPYIMLAKNSVDIDNYHDLLVAETLILDRIKNEKH